MSSTGKGNIEAEVVGTLGASRIVGLAPATLSTLRCRGGGPPYYKVGRRVVYRIAELRAWVDARAATSTSSTQTTPATVESTPEE